MKFLSIISLIFIGTGSIKAQAETKLKVDCLARLSFEAPGRDDTLKDKLVQLLSTYKSANLFKTPYAKSHYTNAEGEIVKQWSLTMSATTISTNKPDSLSFRDHFHQGRYLITIKNDLKEIAKLWDNTAQTYKSYLTSIENIGCSSTELISESSSFNILNFD